VRGEVEHRRERLARVVARLQDAHVGIDDLVHLVVVELVREEVAPRGRAVPESAPLARLEGLHDRVHGLLLHELHVLVGHAAPDADRVGPAVAVVTLHDDALGGERPTRGLRDGLAHVDQAVRAVLRRREPTLRFDVGDRECVALVVGDRERAH
jgi:hypothetical protein